MATDSLAGRVVKGYEFVQKIGEGGYGSVYRAYQDVIEREVAVKVIRAEYANQPDFIRQFQIEAQLVARLEHPFIVPLYDYWRDPDGAYLVMRWVSGGSLYDMLKQGGLDLNLCLKLTRQVGSALTRAHSKRVVHRDLKPHNILLDEDPNAYLADFGIARQIEQDAGSAKSDKVTGTFAYMSPEQLQMADITPQSDVYSFGVMLYEMLTGRHPLADLSVSEMMIHHLHEPMPYLAEFKPGLPEELDDVIQAATAKLLDDRYPDIAALMSDFEQILRDTAYADSSTHHASPVNLIESGTSTDFVRISEAHIVNPYRGLQQFEEADADTFFGRDALIQELLMRMRENVAEARFLAVVGPSGSGKSSLVKAGLIPALRRGELPGSVHWFITQMVPGNNPFEALAAALERISLTPTKRIVEQLRRPNGITRVISRMFPNGSNTEMLLMIDQFEELFTQVKDETVRTEFMTALVDNLHDPNSRLRIVITLRADFYNYPMQYQEFGRLLDQREVKVFPPTEAELREAISKPAEKVGLLLEQNLENAIVHEVHGHPGMLPLLQYALHELFEAREGLMLTLAAFDNIGGVGGALSRKAESLYVALNDEGKAIIEQVFLRLVTPGEGTEDTRRRVHYTELKTISGHMNPVIELYTDARLLQTDHDEETREPTLEVAHEALIRSWQRLREWLDESREDMQMLRRLEQMAQEWEQSRRDRGLLARDSRLEQFSRWARETKIQLSLMEEKFLVESINAQTTRDAAEQQRQEREEAVVHQVHEFEQRIEMLRTRAMLMGVLAGLAILIAAGSGFLAWQATSRATMAAGIAELAQYREATALADVQTVQSFVPDVTQAAELDNRLRNLSEQQWIALADAGAVFTNDLWTPIVRDFDGVSMVLVPSGCINIEGYEPICAEQSFWMDQYEVTNAVYGDIGTLCGDGSTSEPNQPRNCIAWRAAQQHCESRNATLPAEVEWEFAARGPDGLTYPWGNNFVSANVVFADNANNTIADVGTVDDGVSWVGAYNMAGNVAEWTSTLLGEEATDTATSTQRVYKGGSFQDTSDFIDTTMQFNLDARAANVNVGFRCIRYDSTEAK